MMMEGNEYGQSVILASVPVSAFKCVLSLSVVCPLAAVVSFMRGAYAVYFSCTVAMAKTCESASFTDTQKCISPKWWTLTTV